ncbi:hypothetical protein [Parapedobacter indicus]|uniref:Beta-ketoacyl synthase, N-terminal domain n=1 Tax=Parapedobacter indicus TaxID=1477437 RepID=A0A1I3FI63_9SPHI|nr:hypothetical protein [Parapedobacter indicus]PPL03736.1 hypothetical protein CLV26_102344 [Parapedobacter indicus]SFI10876.1 hypothetical protein SAMN05444682_102344 [Parapedobacter indicus]
MDASPSYIQSYCTIRDRSIVLNGTIFLKMDIATPLADFLKSAYRQLDIDYPKFHKMDSLCKAIFIATELMARHSGPYASDTALIFSNRSSSYLSDNKHATGIFDTENQTASPATFVYTLPNIALGEISIRHQLHSENVFFIFDRYLPEFLVPYTEAALDDKQIEHAIGGWTEISEHTCDLLLYHIGKLGSIPHTVAKLKRIYNEHE